MADDTVEECMAHIFDSELAARDPVHKHHLMQESARETYWIVTNGITLASKGDCVHTYLWRETQG